MASGVPRKTWACCYMDAAHEWAGELNGTSGYGLQVSLVPEPRAGVWRIVVRALHVVDGRPCGVVCSRTVIWPDASYQGLGASIFGAVSGLERDLLVDDLAQASAPA